MLALTWVLMTMSVLVAVAAVRGHVIAGRLQDRRYRRAELRSMERSRAIQAEAARRRIALREAEQAQQRRSHDKWRKRADWSIEFNNLLHETQKKGIK